MENVLLLWFYELPADIQIVLLYAIVINIVTFFFYGFDKLQAKLGNRRVRERMLWFLAAIGGSLGAFLAVEFFRHKRRKVSFMTILFLIFLVHLGLLSFILVQ